MVQEGAANPEAVRQGSSMVLLREQVAVRVRLSHQPRCFESNDDKDGRFALVVGNYREERSFTGRMQEKKTEWRSDNDAHDHDGDARNERRYVWWRFTMEVVIRR